MPFHGSGWPPLRNFQSGMIKPKRHLFANFRTRRPPCPNLAPPLHNHTRTPMHCEKQNPTEMQEQENNRENNRAPLLLSSMHKQLLATVSWDDACEDTKIVRELKETKPSSLLDGSLSDALGVLARLQNALARLFPSNAVLLDVCLALVGLQLDEQHARWQYALQTQPMARLRRHRLSLSAAKAEIEQPTGKLPFFTAGSMAV
eukprot:1577142-Rhodomonas_salina.1